MCHKASISKPSNLSRKNNFHISQAAATKKKVERMFDLCCESFPFFYFLFDCCCLLFVVSCVVRGGTVLRVRA